MTNRRPPPRGDAARIARRRRRIITIVAGVLVLAGVGVLAVLTVTQDVDFGSPLSAVAGNPEIEGEPLGPPPDDGATLDPAIGATAPVVTGADFNDRPVVIGTPGTGQLLMFMASWCPICQEELPVVVDWMEQGRMPDDVELVAVATMLDPQRPNWPPQNWFERERFTGPILVDDTDATVALTFGLPATPYWVALDPEGRVVSRVSGMLSADDLDDLAAQVTGS